MNEINSRLDPEDGFWFILVLCVPAWAFLVSSLALEQHDGSGPGVAQTLKALRFLGLLLPVFGPLLLYHWVVRPPLGLVRVVVAVLASAPTLYQLWRLVLWVLFLSGRGGYTG